MASVELNKIPVSPLAAVKSSRAVTNSVDQQNAGVSLQLLDGCAIAQLFAKKGQTDAVVSALAIGKSAGRATVTEDYTAMPLSPGQWMLTAATGADGSFSRQLQARVQDAAYVSEQSHGRVILRVSGRDARRVMQKGCRLDLHHSVAGSGFCAQTPIAQVGVLIHQVDNDPTYDLHLYSGFAHSFWHWLTESAAEFGYRIS